MPLGLPLHSLSPGEIAKGKMGEDKVLVKVKSAAEANFRFVFSPHLMQNGSQQILISRVKFVCGYRPLAKVVSLREPPLICIDA